MKFLWEVLTASQWRARQTANLALAGIVVFFACTIARFLLDGFSLVAGGVSADAAGPHGGLVTTGLLGLGVGGLLLAWPLSPKAKARRDLRLGPITLPALLAVWGGYCVVAALWRELLAWPLGSSSLSLMAVGTVTLGVVAGLAVSIGVLLCIGRNFGSQWITGLSIATGALAGFVFIVFLGDLVVTHAVPQATNVVPNPSSIGVLEESFYVLVALWSLCVTAGYRWLLRTPMSSREAIREQGNWLKQDSLIVVAASFALEFLTDLTPYQNVISGVLRVLKGKVRTEKDERRVLAWAGDAYVLVMLLAMIVLWRLSKPGAYILALIAVWRLVDILATNLRILVVDINKPGWGIVSAPRSVLLGLINVVQIALIFAIADFVWANGSFDHSLTGPASPDGFLYLSWTTLITLGSGFVPIGGAARALVMAEAGASVLMFVVILAAFISSLMQIQATETLSGPK